MADRAWCRLDGFRAFSRSYSSVVAVSNGTSEAPVAITNVRLGRPAPDQAAYWGIIDDGDENAPARATSFSTIGTVANF